MRPFAMVPLLALLMLPAAAAGKEGVIYSPSLGGLTPGQPTRVTMTMEQRWKDGLRPLLVLESVGGGRTLRFRASPLHRQVATLTVTLPARPKLQRWFASVRVAGRPVEATGTGLTAVDLERGMFVAGGPHTMTGETTVFHPAVVKAPARADASGMPAWPFVVAGVLGSAGIGLWWRRRRA